MCKDPLNIFEIKCSESYFEGKIQYWLFEVFVMLIGG